MKLKLEMLTGMSGPDTNVTRGDDYACGLDEAVRMVLAGLAKTKNEKDEKVVTDAIAAAEAEAAEKAEAEAAEAEAGAKKAATK